jgi:hypothetical protein
MTQADEQSRKQHLDVTKRFLKVACKDMLGQERKTFTTDEKGKQNSPSFNSAYEFFKWKEEAINYPFRYEFNKTLTIR